MDTKGPSAASSSLFKLFLFSRPASLSQNGYDADGDEGVDEDGDDATCRRGSASIPLKTCASENTQISL